METPLINKKGKGKGKAKDVISLFIIQGENRDSTVTDPRGKGKGYYI